MSNAQPRPNIVLVMADDLGFSDLGCYGGEIATPNLDSLAANGLRFTHAYNNAVCVATRTSLLTGLYPHQVDGNAPRLSDANNVTLAEVLREAGYRTLMVGKWHNGSRAHELPVNRGFDRYWGLLSGCSNYFNPGLKRLGEPEPAHKAEGNTRPWGDDDRVIHPFTPDDPDFYTTDAFTDKAVEFLKQYGHDEQSFFLYLPHCAPHFPMQAWPEDSERYRGKYMVGWDEVRRRRYERLLQEGLVEERWGVSGRDEWAPSWDEVEDREAWDLKMAVYAAMVDRMDRGIGRVLDTIRALGKWDDTLILFLSDNGGCAESLHRTPNVSPGPVNSYHTVDAPWANASNTPFRLFKVFNHEGGIATPMIVHWPKAIGEPGTLHDVCHVMDFMPTFCELAGAEYPSEYAGRDVLPMEGRSFAPVFKGETLGDRSPLCWQLRDCRAVRDGKWKLVSQGGAWELYDMEADRCELDDLSGELPDRAVRLADQWEAWSRRCAHWSQREGLALAT